MRDPDHPTFGLDARSGIKEMLDRLALKQWTLAEEEATRAARAAARRDQAVTVLVYGTLAAFWAVVALLAVWVLS